MKKSSTCFSLEARLGCEYRTEYQLLVCVFQYFVIPVAGFILFPYITYKLAPQIPRLWRTSMTRISEIDLGDSDEPSDAGMKEMWCVARVMGAMLQTIWIVFVLVASCS